MLVSSHAWLHGSLEQPFDPAAFDAGREGTWPLVLPKSDYSFVTREGKPALAAAMPQRVRWIRDATAGGNAPCKLSVLFVRWNGATSKWMDEQEANDGDWGKYGSPPSDEYMGHIVELGLEKHAALHDSEGTPLFELQHYMVSSSKDMYQLTAQAGMVRATMKGQKRVAFWMLWPAEWEDFDDPDYACYVDKTAMFNAMRACEGVAIRSLFPHGADQYELITSKSWMATLSVHPSAYLPAATLVNKASVKINAKAAADMAMKALHHIRAMNPFPVQPGEPPAPSAINKDGIVKGVVKLGWSWENRFVVNFTGEKQLEARLKEMLGQPGCKASYCIVQEWVDFDFEMRLYFTPPADWPEKSPIKPTMIQCNAWGVQDENRQVGTSRANFSKLSEEKVLQRWENDAAAWEDCKEKATKISQFLLAWLISADAQPVPSLRIDFMVSRLGPGKARVVFGEYCEQGACCLGWVDGPPTIWRSCIDSALR